jgi:hypothetical protein
MALIAEKSRKRMIKIWNLPEEKKLQKRVPMKKSAGGF